MLIASLITWLNKTGDCMLIASLITLLNKTGAHGRPH